MQLDKTQQSIVDSKQDKILVIAGAGSGKTRVLIERIKSLLQSGVEPSSIVAITYTNMASDEMTERLKDVVGADSIFVGTIHSFANRILGKRGYQDYKIYSQYEQDKLMIDCIKKYCRYVTTEKYLEFIDLREKVEKGKINKKHLSTFFSEEAQLEIDYLNGDFLSTNYPQLETIRKELHYITFDELLRKARYYFERNNLQVDYLFVDELQDIAKEEFQFIKGLNSKHEFFVGDDWQSIYSFKGADVNIFLSLIESKDYEVFHMSNNYRNARKIVEEAEKVIYQIDVVKKETICVRENTGLVKLGKKENLKDVVDMIKTEDYNKWFILVRSNKFLNEVGERLEKLKIPFTNFKKADMTLEELKTLLSENTMKVLTIHTAKGLETNNVILYGDHFNMKKNSWQRDEESKVMYVGMTRAKNKLFILNK